MKEKFVEKYLVLYRIDNRWKVRIYSGHNPNEIEEKFRSSKLFNHMLKDCGDRYMIFVFTGVEDYV